MAEARVESGFRLRRGSGLSWLEVGGAGWRLAVSTREGGVSVGPYASLNLGFLVGDRSENVVANRRRLLAALGIDPARLVVPHQVHGTVVREVAADDGGCGALDPTTAVGDCDALLTSAFDVALMVSVADCVPVFVAASADGQASRIALIHAGWRGLAEGIVGAAARRTARAAVLRAAAIGPSIGPCCFTVSEPVGQRFAASWEGSYRDGRVDLWRVARLQLEQAGIAPSAIVEARVCTMCDGRFFSHRCEGGLTGRQAAIAWMPAKGSSRKGGGVA